MISLSRSYGKPPCSCLCLSWYSIKICIKRRILQLMESLLEIKNVDLYLAEADNRTQILHDISFNVLEGGKVGLVGPSGSGKSMIARAILGLNGTGFVVSNGTIIFRNGDQAIDLLHADLNKVRASEIGIVFQHSAKVLNPSRTVGDQIREKVQLHDPGGLDTQDMVLGLLSEVALEPAERFYSAYPHQLSGGQLQRCLIALALANDPKLIIADEPLSALDSATSEDIIQLLSTIQQKRGMALVLISHDLQTVLDFCDEIVILEDGQVVSYGDTGSLYDTDQPELVKDMIASLVIEAAEKRSPSVDAEPLMSVQNVSKTYSDQNKLISLPWSKKARAENVLHDVSLDIFENEILGIYGPSGCGKSTLSRLICRLEATDNGAIYFNGKDISQFSKSEVQAFRRSCQIIFQDPLSAMSPHRSVKSHLEDVNHMGGSHSHGDIVRILSEVGLESQHLDRFPHQLSGGERQRVLIARALLTGAQFLVCDEIFSSLDILVSLKIAAMLRDLVEKRGLTALFISHDRQMMERLATRIINMEDLNILGGSLK